MVLERDLHVEVSRHRSDLTQNAQDLVDMRINGRRPETFGLTAEERAHERRTDGPGGAEHVDELTLFRSCWADGLNHVGSVCQMNTGSILAGRPSMGAWVTYGLGTANNNLPSFVILTDAGEGTVERGTETYRVAVRDLKGAERDRIYAEQARRYPGFARLTKINSRPCWL